MRQEKSNYFATIFIIKGPPYRNSVVATKKFKLDKNNLCQIPQLSQLFIFFLKPLPLSSKQSFTVLLRPLEIGSYTRVISLVNV